MKKCPYCGHENEDQAENCERCRAGLPHEETNTEKPKRVKRNNKE